MKEFCGHRTKENDSRTWQHNGIVTSIKQDRLEKICIYQAQGKKLHQLMWPSWRSQEGDLWPELVVDIDCLSTQVYAFCNPNHRLSSTIKCW